MTTWALLRFVKFVSVALLTVAILGGVFAPDARMRRRLGVQLGTFALMGVMLAGYGLTKNIGASIGEPWIARGLLAGLVAYGAGCWGGVPNRSVWWTGVGRATKCSWKRVLWVAALIGGGSHVK